MGNAEAQLRNAQAEINRQLEENEELKSRMICIDNLSGDESISFYTGFPNLQTFQATLVYLNPGNGQNIRYWRSTNKKVQAHHYDGDNQKNKSGRKRTLKPGDDFFLVMCRLRQGFNEAPFGIFVWHLSANSQQDFCFLDQLDVSSFWHYKYLAQPRGS